MGGSSSRPALLDVPHTQAVAGSARVQPERSGAKRKRLDDDTPRTNQRTAQRETGPVTPAAPMEEDTPAPSPCAFPRVSLCLGIRAARPAATPSQPLKLCVSVATVASREALRKREAQQGHQQFMQHDERIRAE